MWKLEVYRVINSVGGWIPMGEFQDIRQLLNTCVECGAYLQRILDPNGRDYHTVEWVDDDFDPDYLKPVIGPICNNWPQKIGDIR